MNINKLKGKIIEKGLNIEQTADLIGIDRSSLYRKMNNFEKITIGEAQKLAKVLELTAVEAYDIFLSRQSHIVRHERSEAMILLTQMTAEEKDIVLDRMSKIMSQILSAKHDLDIKVEFGSKDKEEKYERLDS